jgi:hypothetical protein
VVVSHVQLLKCKLILHTNNNVSVFICHKRSLFLFIAGLVLEYDAADSKQIQIRCQPRPKFRPRTENESKNSSHYLRCDEGVKPEYPTINVCHPFISCISILNIFFFSLDSSDMVFSNGC